MVSYIFMAVPATMATPVTTAMLGNRVEQHLRETQNTSLLPNRLPAYINRQSCSMRRITTTISAPKTLKFSPKKKNTLNVGLERALPFGPLLLPSTAMRAATSSLIATTQSSVKPSKSPNHPNHTTRLSPYLTRREDHQVAHVLSHQSPRNKLRQKPSPHPSINPQPPTMTIKPRPKPSRLPINGLITI